MSQWLEQIIERQTLQNVSAPEQVPALTMESDGIFCLVDFTYVSEVIELQHIISYPVPSTLHLGIINMRGDIIPILSLSNLLNNGAKSSLPNKGRIVVFNGPHGYFGVIAESVKKVVVDARMLEANEELNLGDQIYKLLKSDFFEAVRGEAA